jgi:hypothetical protein
MKNVLEIAAGVLAAFLGWRLGQSLGSATKLGA